MRCLQTPFCRTPSLPSSRQSSLRGSRDCIASVLGNLSDLNYIEGFWTCYDIFSNLRDNFVQWSTDSVQARGTPATGKSVEALASDLYAQVGRLSVEKEAHSVQGVVVSYLYEVASFLVNQAPRIDASGDPS